MKRIASRGAALALLAILAMYGEAAAFTPVPIPKPRAGSAITAAAAHEQAHAVSRQLP